MRPDTCAHFRDPRLIPGVLTLPLDHRRKHLADTPPRPDVCATCWTLLDPGAAASRDHTERSNHEQHLSRISTPRHPPYGQGSPDP